MSATQVHTLDQQQAQVTSPQDDDHITSYESASNTNAVTQPEPQPQSLPASTTTTTSTTAATIAPNQPKPQTDLVGTTCMELALEGERLCQTGDLKSGVKFFEEAIRVGTTDDRTLSAIYSQLGNAYFYLEDYQRALEYHKQDVTLVHSIGDEAAEAKACGNLGNTFKMLGKFDEAAVYCRRYLEISRKLGDEIGEGRALYNLGNVYHMQGKRMIGTSEQDSGELPNDIKSSLQRAIEYYEANLKVVSKLNDHVAMGRAYGNLGNTHYLLGNFQLAVESHKKRLELARQTNDKSAERRAHLNLGNANVFLGNFSEAIKNYSSTLELAKELNDKHTEAHSCYSLANTYTFLRDYKSAIQYHLKYLDLIRELDDKLGEGRACWSLVNIYQMVNDPESALVYAKKHYEIAQLLGDETGLTSARANIEELEDTIAQKQAILRSSTINITDGNPIGSGSSGVSSGRVDTTTTIPNTTTTNSSVSFKRHGGAQERNSTRLSPDKRQEQEQRRFKKQLNNNLAGDIDGLAAVRRRGKGGGIVRSPSSERLLDMIAHFQSGRIDDQRCEIIRRPIAGGGGESSDVVAGGASKIRPGTTGSEDKENSSKGSSTNSINNAISSAPRTSQPSITNPINAVSAAASAIKATYRKASLAAYPTTSHAPLRTQRRPTVSVEHQDQLFDLIATSQGQRMDEQRASLPALTLANGLTKSSTNNSHALSRGQTIDHATTKPAVQQKPDTIYEDGSRRAKERSHSVAPSQINLKSTNPNTSTTTTINASGKNDEAQQSSRAKPNRLSRHFQTVDSPDGPIVQDEKFLDSLMRYQSTRFDDQRSEFPKQRDNNTNKQSEKDNFFNLIVKFQSDRIDDQRSAPPITRNKNV
uniref:G-protein-signaling modulator 1 n=1 Tax=Aceria tosichella TaxID=561515 RepID=A0A6G1SHK5_9ACAR